MKPKRRSFLIAYLRSLIFGQKEIISIMEEELVQSPFRTVLRNFVRRRLTQFGIVVFSIIFLLCFIIPWFLPLDLGFFDSSMQHRPPGRSMMNYDRALRGNVRNIGVGSGFGVGVSNDGNIYTWGLGNGPQFGDGISNAPTRAETGRIVQVSAGENHALALNAHGWVFTWGNRNFNLPEVPARIQGHTVQVVAGTNYSIAITEDGQVHVWGTRAAVESNIFPRNLRGVPVNIVANPTAVLVQLEGGEVQHLSRPGTHVFTNIPDDIQGRVQHIALANHNGAAILDDGTVRVWGHELEPAYNVPVDEIGNRAIAIEAGLGHFTVLLNDGTLVGWGNDYYGQASPPNLRNVTRIYSNFHHNYAVDANGNIHTWGLRGFVFGTDDLGRDVLVRTFGGGRWSMTVGAIAIVISAVIGLILGGFAGYFGGVIDMIIMRFSEIWSSLPFLPIAIILVHILGNDVSQMQRILIIMVVMGILGWPALMRLVRGQVFQVKESEYVLAARCLGISEVRIIFKHIFPNIMSVITVWLALNLAGSMLTESALSFIGFGVTEPTPTWGNIISAATGSSVVIRNFWWRWVPSAIMITLAAISINMIGDGLREAVDPKSQER
ncbi:MAG: ABC transporter permease subunit [Firmicutes bacterium]|nr:ABC transporter permease subunit [Bacillota bacterium]